MFTPATGGAVRVSFPALLQAASAGDFDGDGRSDFHGATEHEVIVFNRQGLELARVSTDPTLQSFASGGGGRLIGDLNSDGRDELAITKYIGPPGAGAPAQGWIHDAATLVELRAFPVPEQVWRTVQEQLPQLVAFVESVLESDE